MSAPPGRQSGDLSAETMTSSNVVVAGDVSTIAANVDHFVKRLLQDAVADATRQWWLKRAQDFEAARPVPGEFHGQATPEELNARWSRLTEVAKACRGRAEVSLLDRQDAAADVANVLEFSCPPD